MKIRTALTLKYTCITATIFLLCMVLIYLVSEHTRDQTFFRNLKSEGITKANLFLAGQVDAKTMQSVYLNNRKFINEVEVAVYTTDFHMLYHDAIHNDIVKETEGMIKEIIQKKEIEFHIGKYQGIGMVFQYKGKDYIVTAAAYDGYGSCPLTVERGKIVLAEFGYGGVLKPSFPKILLDGTKPSRAAWFLKERMLPPIYWHAMLKGREWLCQPAPIAPAKEAA